MRVQLNAQDPKPGCYLTDDEFRFIYSRVPCLCLDIVIIRDGGILFAKREIEPFKGFWTLPGGIVRYKESIHEAFNRLLKNELGGTCASKDLLGYIHAMDDGPFRSSVSLAFLAEYQGEIRGSEQGYEFRFISDFSGNDVQPYQADFFRKNWEAIMG